jgi:hypothetical protein
MSPLMRNKFTNKKKRQKSLPRALNFSLLNLGSLFAYEHAGITQILVQHVLRTEE